MITLLHLPVSTLYGQGTSGDRYKIQRRACHCTTHKASAINHESSTVPKPFLVLKSYGRPQQLAATPMRWCEHLHHSQHTLCVYSHNQHCDIIGVCLCWIASKAANFHCLHIGWMEFHSNNDCWVSSHAHYLSKPVQVGLLVMAPIPCAKLNLATMSIAHHIPSLHWVTWMHYNRRAESKLRLGLWYL